MTDDFENAADKEYLDKALSAVRDSCIYLYLSSEQRNRFNDWVTKRGMTKQNAFAKIIEAGMKHEGV